MRKKNKFFFLALIPLFLTACATGYQKEGVFSNGYSDFKLSEGQFVVTFRANEHTQPEKVMQYTLKRASKLALQNGYRYFAILDQMGSSRDSAQPHLHYPSLRLTIQCFHDKPLDREVIDARQFLSLNEDFPYIQNYVIGHGWFMQ